MDTIFALATPMLKSGVAVIRISGERAISTIKSITRAKVPEARQCVLRKIYDTSDNIIDEALVITFKAPNSFTGEDVVEIQTHGSIAVISQLLEVLSSFEGLRMANAGEFSKRAFENGQMDLTQAEGLSDLIDSETKAQAKQAVRQMQGYQGSLYEKWREILINIFAQLEAYIDFPDEEIPDDVLDHLKTDLDNLKEQLSEHLNDNNVGEKLKNGLNAVIIGAPNAGKSSLLNALTKRNVAIVSDIAGTTRDLIEVNLDIQGYPLTLIDSAGLRETQNIIEEEGVRRAIDKAKNADFKIAIFDASSSNIDEATTNLIDENTVIILNKIDLLEDKQNNTLDKHEFNNKILNISTKTQKNIDQLNNWLVQKCKQILQTSDAPVITRQRHRNLLNKTLESLNEFSFEKELELSAQDLRFAANYLGQITGRIDVEDVLDALFSQFCIGK